MSHAVNRNAFLSAAGCGHPLLSAYGLLVATELGLKDHAAIWQGGHNVPKMLDAHNDPGLTALGAQLRTELAAIPCTDLRGNPAPVAVNRYPDLRYTRHAEDFVGGTTDPDLQKLVQTVQDIILQLRAKGVPV
jgi:hypothetical protein